MKESFFKVTVIVLLLAGSFSSCKEKEKCEPFVLIGQDSLSGREGIPQQDIVITTQEEWEDLKITMINTENFRETEIDFEEFQIIAVFDKVRPSGSWKIAITCTTEYSDSITVTVHTIAPKGHDFSVEVQPYHIVKIPVTKKSIEFKYL